MNLNTIVADTFGFDVYNETMVSILRIEWNELIEIIAYKQDLFSYDEVWFGFRTKNIDEYYHVNEETKGFYEFAKSLPKFLNSFDADWSKKVFSPAFERNQQTIYGIPFK